MRHQNKGNKLSRHTAHRSSMMRNLVTSLFEHGRVETTHAKAKAARPVAEKLVTLAKRGDLHARRQAAAFVRSPGDGPAPVRLLGRALRRPERRLHADPARRLPARRRRRPRVPGADRSGRRHRRAAPAARDDARRIARRRSLPAGALALAAPRSRHARRPGGADAGTRGAVLEIVEFSDLVSVLRPGGARPRRLSGRPSGRRAARIPALPASIHEHAARAAQAAIEAQRQGAFWPYHDHVFRTRPR